MININNPIAKELIKLIFLFLIPFEKISGNDKNIDNPIKEGNNIT